MAIINIYHCTTCGNPARARLHPAGIMPQPGAVQHHYPKGNFTMTEKPKQTINITKAKRGWDVETIVYWPGIKHPAVGYNQESTLAIALWKTVDKAFQVTAITVKGKVLTNRDAYQSIEDSLTRGRMAHMLPGYREALGL